MLTNSKEYKELSVRIAIFLNTETTNIYDIVNPMRKKTQTSAVWQAILCNGRSVLLRDLGDSFVRI